MEIGYPVQITENLDIALRNFRGRALSKLFWIDALCINQADAEEREAQVQLMRRIFSSATRTVIWLGEDDPSTADAIECINLLNRASARVKADDQRGQKLLGTQASPVRSMETRAGRQLFS